MSSERRLIGEESALDNGTQPRAARKPRSDKGKPKKNGKTAAAALIDTIAALQGLSDEDIRKVLSAASIFLGVANFEPRAQ